MGEQNGHHQGGTRGKGNGFPPNASRSVVEGQDRAQNMPGAYESQRRETSRFDTVRELITPRPPEDSKTLWRRTSTFFLAYMVLVQLGLGIVGIVLYVLYKHYNCERPFALYFLLMGLFCLMGAILLAFPLYSGIAILEVRRRRRRQRGVHEAEVVKYFAKKGVVVFLGVFVLATELVLLCAASVWTFKESDCKDVAGELWNASYVYTIIQWCLHLFVALCLPMVTWCFGRDHFQQFADEGL